MSQDVARVTHVCHHWKTTDHGYQWVIGVYCWVVEPMRMTSLDILMNIEDVFWEPIISQASPHSGSPLNHSYNKYPKTSVQIASCSTPAGFFSRIANHHHPVKHPTFWPSWLKQQPLWGLQHLIQPHRPKQCPNSIGCRRCYLGLTVNAEPNRLVAPHIQTVPCLGTNHFGSITYYLLCNSICKYNFEFYGKKHGTKTVDVAWLS